MATLILRPSYDLSSVWSSYPADGVRYDKVDEITSDEDTTYIQTSIASSSSAQFYNKNGFPTGYEHTINSIKFVIEYKYNGDNADSEIRVSIGSYHDGNWRNWIEGIADLPGSADVYNTKEIISYTNSYTGNAWTWFELDSLKAGPFVQKGGSLNYVRVTQFYIEVDFIAIPPTVTTQSATDIKGNYCTGNGNTTNDGGDNIIERGFEYGIAEEAQFCVRQVGTDLGTGAYTLTIDGLQPETNYYYRAFATNSAGEGYGDWVPFTTTALASYGIYEESNSQPDSDGIYANSNAICFYVRKVGGKWSIKHGPYTSDQADIEITKILTEGKGKYQIKFTSDVLTGLSASIMCKLDIKARG